MIELPIIDAENQTFEILLEGERWRFELTYNRIAERFVMRFAINGVTMLEGRKLVETADLIGQFRFGRGWLVLMRYDQTATAPDYDSVVRGRYRLYHISEGEVAALPPYQPTLLQADLPDELDAGTLLAETTEPLRTEASEAMIIDRG